VSYIQTYKALRREIALSHEIIRGSAVFLSRLCGKPNCRCLDGHKHRSLYLSGSYKGKTTMMYVPQKNQDKILEAALRYRKIRNLLNELSQANLKKLLGDR
jgi:hypothetical protein